MNISRILAILAAGLPLLANPLEAKPRSCRVVYPERPNGAPKFAYLFDGSKSREIHLPSMNFSEVVELSAGELTIAMTTSALDDPETLPASAPRLKIPEATLDFYIILTPDEENPYLPIRMNLVDTGGGKLKPGDTLWFNSTNHRIAARLGSADMVVEPKNRIVCKAPVETSGHYVAKFAFQADGEGAFAPITEQFWWHDVASRHLGFIVDSGGSLPKIYFYRDFRDPVAVKNGD